MHNPFGVRLRKGAERLSGGVARRRDVESANALQAIGERFSLEEAPSR